MEQRSSALGDIGFTLTHDEAQDIIRGKDFVQLKNGPFDLDLVLTTLATPVQRGAYSDNCPTSGSSRVHAKQRVHREAL